MQQNNTVMFWWLKLNESVDWVTEQTLRNGEVQMRAKDEEIRFLRMQLAEEERIVNLMKRSLPSKRSVEQEIVTLQIQVINCIQKLRRMGFCIFCNRAKSEQQAYLMLSLLKLNNFCV